MSACIPLGAVIAAVGVAQTSPGLFLVGVSVAALGLGYWLGRG